MHAAVMPIGGLGRLASCLFSVALLAAPLGACGSKSSDATGDDTDGGIDPPAFNFIPDNSEACSLPKTPELRPLALKNLGFLAQSSAFVGHDFEVCPAPGAADDTSVCPPCVDNPLRELLEGADAGSLLRSGEETVSFTDYFRRAMAYPFRDLLVFTREVGGGMTELVLGQGTPATCDASTDADCPDYIVRHETLTNECKAPMFSASLTSGDIDGLPGHITELYDLPFTFLVPLTESLPTVPDPDEPIDWAAATTMVCPSEAEVTSTTHLARYLACQPQWRVPVEEAVVTIRKHDGVQCGYLQGLLDPDEFPDAIDPFVDVEPFEDDSGYVPVTLRFRLDKADVAAEE